MTFEKVVENACFGGTQGVYKHSSQELDCEMRLAVFTPPQAEVEPCPVVFWLSGLTCTEENFTVKAGSVARAPQTGSDFSQLTRESLHLLHDSNDSKQPVVGSTDGDFYRRLHRM